MWKICSNSATNSLHWAVGHPGIATISVDEYMQSGWLKWNTLLCVFYCLMATHELFSQMDWKALCTCCSFWVIPPAWCTFHLAFSVRVHFECFWGFSKISLKEYQLLICKPDWRVGMLQPIYSHEVMLVIWISWYSHQSSISFTSPFSFSLPRCLFKLHRKCKNLSSFRFARAKLWVHLYALRSTLFRFRFSSMNSSL